MGLYHCFSLIACLAVSSCNEETARAPEITKFSPLGGIDGTTFRIGGYGFDANINNNQVSINGVNAKVIGATPLVLTVIAPKVFTTGKIKIVVNNREVTSTVDFVRNYEMQTLAGSTFGFSDGSGTNAKFYGPSGITVGADGNVYVADRQNSRIRQVTLHGLTSTVAGSDIMGFVDGPLATAQFGNITSIAVDPDGNIFITEDMSSAIRKISTSGIVSVFAGSVTQLGDIDGVGNNARFGHLGGIVADQNGNIYVVDYNNKIRKVTPDGTVSTLAGSTSGNADGIGAAAQFNFRLSGASIAVDVSGHLYVTDVENFSVRKITQAGVVTTVASNSTGAQFQALAGIAVDSKGNIYVIDNPKSLVRKITPEGVVTTVAGTSTGFKDGDATTAQLSTPLGIAVDKSGNLFIADTGNNSIRQLVP